MKTWTRFSLLLAFVALIGLPLSAQAQTSLEIGPRVGIGLGDSPTDELFVGADLRVSTAALPVQINPTLDYYFVDAPEGFNASLFHFTANALYPFGIDNQAFTPYAGAGVSIARLSSESEDGSISSSNTETGLNLLGGAIFETDNLKPFVQANFTLGSDAEFFGIAGGLLFEI